jgi:uroporphyrinogen decarboxylase
MNSKERALRAFNHEEPDRVPLEGVAWGEWSYPFLRNVLLPYLGLEAGELSGSTGFCEEQDLLARTLGIDFRPVTSDPPTDFQRRAEFDPLFENAWGLRIASDILQDEWGIQRQLNATKTQSRVIRHPLKGAEGLDQYVFPDPEAPGRFDSAEKLASLWGDEYAISASPADGFFLQGWYLRGFEDLILDMHSNPAFVDQLFDKLLEFYLSAGRHLAEIGVDIYVLSDDVAMQTGLIISPRLWRRYVKPRVAKLVSSLKQLGMRTLYHSDGNVEPLIPDLIEVGIDALNPIQPECMDPAKTKELYGEKLCLSGTISVQETLPFGSVEDVKDEVEKRIVTCGSGGGLIICPSNQATIDVKPENFVAVYESAKKFGRYPSLG